MQIHSLCASVLFSIFQTIHRDIATVYLTKETHTNKAIVGFFVLFFFFSERIHLLTFLKNIFPISLRQIWKSNQKLQAVLRWKALRWGEALWVHPRSGDWWIDYSLYWNQGSRIHCQDDDKPNLWAHRIHNLKQRASIPKTYASPERDTWWERFYRPGWGVREKGKLPWNHTWSSSVRGLYEQAMTARRGWLHRALKKMCIFPTVWFWWCWALRISNSCSVISGLCLCSILLLISSVSQLQNYVEKKCPLIRKKKSSGLWVRSITVIQKRQLYDTRSWGSRIIIKTTFLFPLYIVLFFSKMIHIHTLKYLGLNSVYQ